MAGPQMRVSADPSAAISALKKIRDELAKVGQEAKTLADIDLGAMPADLSADVQKVVQQYNELLKISSSLRQHVGHTGQSGVAPWNVDYGRLYLDPATAGRRTAQTVSRITSGTRFAPPQPSGAGGGGSGGGGGAAGGGDQDGGGLGGMAGVLGMLGPQLKLIAGLAGLTGIGLMLTKSYRDAIQVGEGTDQVLRTTLFDGMGFDRLRDELRKVGDGFGIANVEAVKLARSFQQNSHILDRAALVQETQGAIAFAKGMGTDVGETARYMARSQATGTSGPGGTMSQREYAMLLGETIARGGMFAKGEQVMDAFGKYVDQVQSSTREAPDGMTEFASLLGSLYGLKGAPGMRQGGAEHVVAALNAGVENPGAGEAGAYLMMRALGPSFNNDPWAMQYHMEKGAFAKLPGQEKTTIQAVFDQVDRDMGGHRSEYAVYSALKNVFPGLSMHDAKHLRSAMSAEKVRGDGGIMGLAQRAGIEPKNEAVGNLARIYAANSDDELRGIAGDLSKSENLSKEKRQEIEARSKDLTGDDLKRYLAQVANNDVKYLETPMSEMAEGVRKISDAMENTVGENLQEIVKLMTVMVGKPAEKVNEIYKNLTSMPGKDADAAPATALDTIKAGTGSGWFDAMKELWGGGKPEQGGAAPKSPIPEAPASKQPIQNEELRQKLSSAEQKAGLPAGLMQSVWMQETGGKDAYLNDPGKHHYPMGSDGKRRASSGVVSSAFGPFGILESTARSPGFGVDPLKDKSLDEQIRFASEYLAARIRASGGDVRGGLAGYGEGSPYADQVLSRLGRMRATPQPAPIAKADDMVAPKSPPVPMAPTSLQDVGVPGEVQSQTRPDSDRSHPRSADKMSGELSVILKQVDPYGRQSAPEQTVNMGLSRKGTYGTVNVDNLYAG